jgi:hypothetical protein
MYFKLLIKHALLKYLRLKPKLKKFLFFQLDLAIKYSASGLQRPSGSLRPQKPGGFKTQICKYMQNSGKGFLFKGEPLNSGKGKDCQI